MKIPTLQKTQPSFILIRSGKKSTKPNYKPKDIVENQELLFSLKN